MLNKRTLLILASVTGVVFLGAVAAVMVRHDATVTALQNRPAFPGLTDHIPGIAKVELSWNDDGAVEKATIERRGEEWVVAEQGGYPADRGKVRDFILSLAELKLVESKTADPARYARLGVSDVTEEGSEATEVRLLDESGTAIVDALIGLDRTSGTGGSMLYLRRGGEERTWLAHGQVEDIHDRSAWMASQILDIDADRIAQIHLTSPSGTTMEIRRVGEGEKPFKLLNMPEGREFKSFYTLNEITDGLKRLKFEDVLPMSGMAFEPSLGNAIFQTKDGLTVIVDFAERADADGKVETWAHFALTVAPDATDEAKSFAEAEAKRVSNWAYRLSDNRLAHLRETLETATKPVKDDPVKDDPVEDDKGDDPGSPKG